MKKGFFTMSLTLFLMLPHVETLASTGKNAGQCIQECVQNYNPSIPDSGEDLLSVETFTAEQCVLFCKDGDYPGSCYFWEDNCCNSNYESIDPDCQYITWTNHFGGAGEDEGSSVQQTLDGGYIITGTTRSFGAGNRDVYLIKTDQYGNTIWEQTFGGSGYDHGRSVQQTIDGGYIIVGQTSSYGAGGYDIYMIKTDADGNAMWEKTFGGTAGETGYSVKQTLDNGYIIAGETHSFGVGINNVYLIKTDTDGNELWGKTFGGTLYNSGNSVEQTNDGGYIVAGRTRSYGTCLADVYLIKTDADGNAIWEKTFGECAEDVGYSVQQTLDGGYIIAGSTQSFGAGWIDSYVIKTDADGNVIWDKIYGGTNIDTASSVQQTADGGYIIAGSTKSFGAGNYDVYLTKTAADGETIWEKTYGGATLDTGYSVQQTLDGGYIVTGKTTAPYLYYEVYLFKTDDNGNID